MTKSRLGLVLAIALGVFACAKTTTSLAKRTDEPSPDARRRAVVGRWFEESATRDGGVRRQLVQRAEDGKFEAEIQVREATGLVSKEGRIGVWGVSGPVLFSITQAAGKVGMLYPKNPRDAAMYDAWEILAVDGDAIRYHAFGSDMETIGKKVPESFVFPDWKS